VRPAGHHSLPILATSRLRRTAAAVGQGKSALGEGTTSSNASNLWDKQREKTTKKKKNSPWTARKNRHIAAIYHGCHLVASATDHLSTFFFS
jgi:hypothetical protein